VGAAESSIDSTGHVTTRTVASYFLANMATLAALACSSAISCTSIA